MRKKGDLQRRVQAAGGSELRAQIIEILRQRCVEAARETMADPAAVQAAHETLARLAGTDLQAPEQQR